MNSPLPQFTGKHFALCATFGGISKVYRACGFRTGWVYFSGRKEHAHEYLAHLELLASLRMYDQNLDQLVPAWSIGYAAMVKAHHLVRRPGQGTPGRAFAERRPIIENRYSDPDGHPEHVGLQSSLSVPLMARGRAIGTAPHRLRAC